jgi:hypothetical protein
VIDLMEKLSLENVVDLVIVSMYLLPEEIPASFQSDYTPIIDAGSPAQIEYLARLLSTQLTAAGYELMKSEQVTIEKRERKSMSNKIDVSLPLSTSAIMSIIPCIPSKKTKSYKLFNVVKPIESNEMERMSIDSFHRILHAEGLLISKINLSIYF